MVNILMVRQFTLSLVSIMSLAVILLAMDKPDTQATGIAIGSAATVLTLAVRGLVDYQDDGEPK